MNPQLQYMAYEYALSKGTILRHKPLIGKESVYFIEDTLGQGGFGITYRASRTIKIGNTPHKLLFAIKEFFVKGQCWRENNSSQMKYSPAAKSEVDECRKDFIDEANRLNKICSENANIVNVNEVFEANDTAYYVMEFLSGKSLRDKILKCKGPLQEKEALALIIPIAESIEYIHTEYGLLHCDISPDNIMLRDNSDGTFTPVLIDFGESLHFNSKGELTTTHNAIGAKEGYAPQEQYRGVTRFDPRIDVYALGATLFYLLTGKKPVSAFDISREYIEKNLSQKISEPVRDAIFNAMAKDKEKRTKDARNFILGITDNDILKRELKPVNRSELPIGYILKNKGRTYEIVSVIKTESYYIQYKALQTGEWKTSASGKTRRAQYDIYELFDQQRNRRQKDETVSATDDISASRKLFLTLCKKITKGEINGEFFNNSNLGWTTFTLNNTFYLVDTHYRKPLSWKEMPEAALVRIIKSNKKAITIASVALLCIWGIFAYGPQMKNWFRDLNTHPEGTPIAISLDSIKDEVDSTHIPLKISEQDKAKEMLYQGLLAKAHNSLNKDKDVSAAEQTLNEIIALDPSFKDSIDVCELQSGIEKIRRQEQNKEQEQKIRRQEQNKEQEKLNAKRQKAYKDGLRLYNEWSHLRNSDTLPQVIEKHRNAAINCLLRADPNDDKVQKMLNTLRK